MHTDLARKYKYALIYRNYDVNVGGEDFKNIYKIYC